MKRPLPLLCSFSFVAAVMVFTIGSASASKAPHRHDKLSTTTTFCARPTTSITTTTTSKPARKTQTQSSSQRAGDTQGVSTSPTSTSKTTHQGLAGASTIPNRSSRHVEKHAPGESGDSTCRSQANPQKPWALIIGTLVFSVILISAPAILIGRRRKKLLAATDVVLFPESVPEEPVVRAAVSDLESHFRQQDGWPKKFGRNNYYIASDFFQKGASGGKTLEESRSDSGKIWHGSIDETFVGALWSEKIQGHGEDAIPMLVIARKEKHIVGAVFDGLGGSGAAKIHWSNGESRSNAWESSRISRSALEVLAATDPTLRAFASSIPHGLEAILFESLNARAEKITTEKTGLSSSLSRTLPTTIAGFALDTKGTPQLATFWAGDSRAFILDSYLGLQVLTKDDAENLDAFAALSADPPLTNVVCADRPFEIHQRRDGLPSQSLVIIATDGCFNYWPTPPNFEFEILQALISASSWEGALRAIDTSIQSVTNDDTSLVIVAHGFKDFQSLQSRFTGRYAELKKIAFDPLVALRLANGTREQFDEYRISAWQEYKKSYESRLGESVENS